MSSRWRREPSWSASSARTRRNREVHRLLQQDARQAVPVDPHRPRLGGLTRGAGAHCEARSDETRSGRRERRSSRRASGTGRTMLPNEAGFGAAAPQVGRQPEEERGRLHDRLAPTIRFGLAQSPQLRSGSPKQMLHPAVSPTLSPTPSVNSVVPLRDLRVLSDPTEQLKDGDPGNLGGVKRRLGASRLARASPR